jgi:heterodisulfide reductase subunit C
MNQHLERTIFPSKRDPDLCTRIIDKAGSNINLCWHCSCCSGGCPFSQAMDYLPNQVIRMAQLGMKQEVLACSAIWICVGCHTCSIQCPMAIDMAAFMDALRQEAIAEGVPIAEPDIFNFHKEVLNSIRRHGRTHKLEIMFRYKLQKKDWMKDLDVGLKMLAKRKLDLMPSKVKNIQKVAKMFEKPKGNAAT